ncbi:MAG: TetR/AcrR family transcriptional regulator [Actinomycetota bacterium]
MGETRRERLRRELTSEILSIARRQLAERGPGAVTWRAIARELGMNPASLYTYFESLDALFTALILQSYASLGDAIEAADAAHLDHEPADRAIACLQAYRAWAVEHPAEFNLIFTDQLPGYVAPIESGTFEAEMAVLRPVIGALLAIDGQTLDDGPLRPADSARSPEADASIGLWAQVHGLVMLEINNHLPVDGRPERFERLIREAVGRRTAGAGAAEPSGPGELRGPGR